MLLVVTLCPFVCALVLFAYFFGRFAGEQDTAKLADAMRQMNYARIIPFPGMERRAFKDPDSSLASDIVATAAPAEVLFFTRRNFKDGQIGQETRGIAKGTTA